ncbi:hypothetical protein J1614_008427 [Plenodomus biglobosus]|nr:hypothetical protein J1614_008427 [Plenodomus biglobosus]
MPKTAGQPFALQIWPARPVSDCMYTPVAEPTQRPTSMGGLGLQFRRDNGKTNIRGKRQSSEDPM